MTEQHDSTVLQTPNPKPVQLGSVRVQSVLKIACIRTAAGLELHRQYCLYMRGISSLEYFSRVKASRHCLKSQVLVHRIEICNVIIRTRGADARFIGQSTFVRKMKSLKRLRETYKAPRRKIPVKETLILLVTCSFHIIGSGIIRNMISSIIFAIPVPSADALTSWHLGSLMLLSQMACTGTHSNIESRNAAMNHEMVNAPAT